MNFSKTTSYALKTLDFMARNGRKRFSTAELHKELRIPLQYLRRVMTDLSKNGFIRGTRGRNGGFVLVLRPARIFIADIIDAIEGLDGLDRCIIGFRKCPFDDVCPMHDSWQEARGGILKVLKTTSLDDLRK
jgi:Rrf2 family protein